MVFDKADRRLLRFDLRREVILSPAPLLPKTPDVCRERLADSGAARRESLAKSSA